MEAREHNQGNLKLLRERLDSGRMRSARLMIHSLHPSEIARLLESLPMRERAALWEMVDSDDEGDVLMIPPRGCAGRGHPLSNPLESYESHATATCRRLVPSRRYDANETSSIVQATMSSTSSPPS